MFHKLSPANPNGGHISLCKSSCDEYKLGLHGQTGEEEEEEEKKQEENE